MKRVWTRARIIGLAVAAIWAACATPITAQSYSWQNAQIIAGGFIDGLIAHPLRQGLFYARADIGGAYRYDSVAKRWIPLTDWVIDNEHLGIDTIAIDPSNPNMFFAVSGEYSNNWDTNAIFLRSSNMGASFTQINLPFRAGSNNDGRNGGERLQVDPNLGSVLYYGTGNDNIVTSQTKYNGLWKSTDTGTTWTQVTGFPTLVNSLAVPSNIYAAPNIDGAGVIFVAFYKASGTTNSPTPTIFAGVSTGTMASTLYVSHDAGNSWAAVSGAPTSLSGSRLYPTRGLIDNANGNLFVTYCGGWIGPNNCNSGQVWRYSIAQSSWTNITPPNPNAYEGGYSGLSLDPSHPGVVVVTTQDRWSPGDMIFRSTDSGATWTQIDKTAHWSYTTAPYFQQLSTAVGNWPAAIVIDPFNPDHLFYGTGGPFWETFSLTSGAASFTPSVGIEEVAVRSIVSPTNGGPYVYSAMDDLCGFAHKTLTASPAAGFFTNPTFPQCAWIDAARAVPTTVVRVGAPYSPAPPFGGISTNSGATWTAFATPSGTSNGAGTVAISADASTILWAPTDIAPVYSTNNGQSWTSLGSQLGTAPQVFADGKSASIFYAWYNSNGGSTLYVSSDKAKTWTKVSTGIGAGGQAVAVTGVQGEVWIASGAGLYHSSNSGTSFTAISGVSSASTVGFGKAGAGASYPAIYLIGTVNNVYGIFRSLDEGVTWVQINDANHNFASPGMITGDPKIFGNVYLATLGRGLVYGVSPN